MAREIKLKRLRKFSGWLKTVSKVWKVGEMNVIIFKKLINRKYAIFFKEDQTRDLDHQRRRNGALQSENAIETNLSHIETYYSVTVHTFIMEIGS